MSQSRELTTTVCMREQIQGHRETEAAVCVETTRRPAPAVSTGAFPLNCVPLCKRQSQFGTLAGARRDDLTKEPAATSTLGPSVRSGA